MTDPIEIPRLSEASLPEASPPEAGPLAASPPPPSPLAASPPGGQRGNRNALKHGFYARAYSSSEVKDLETYTFKGLQDEIAALRLLNRRAIQRAFLQPEDDLAFQDAARVVIDLTVALNSTLRTQIELEHFGGSEFDIALQQALMDLDAQIGRNPVA